MRLRILLVISVALAGVTVTAARASADDSLSRSKAHYDKGAALFSQSKYKEAIDAFQKAYDARPFAQFLYNMGASYEKLKDYGKAADHYERYLKADPKATDKAAVEKRIAALRKASTAPKPTNPDGTTTPAAPIAGLTEAKIRGLVVVESEPSGAHIYLDSKKKAAISRTPWNGALEGEHTIFIEKKGYKPVEKRFSPDPNQLTVFVFTLAEQDYLGWIDIRSDPPGASIYIDDKTAGAYAKTPFSGNVKPGKHTIWIHAEGYKWNKHEIEIIAGKTHSMSAKLVGAPVGYLNFRGSDIDRTKVYLDGKVLCETPPCRVPVAQGKHKLQVKRRGYKTYTRNIIVNAKTETTVRAKLAKRPGRGDAIWAYVFAAAFTGGGIWAGLQAKGINDELQSEIDAGNPPPDSNDPRFRRGKFYSIGADSAFVVGGISLLTAVYYTFRDKGKPSTGSTDVRALALEPKIGPNYIGMEMKW